MEHRWGERFAVHITVELSSGSSPLVAGYLENVSSSGAFVRTEGPRPPRGPVALILCLADHGGRTHCVRVPAYVVRETEVGVAMEWREFAPRAVRELMRRSPGAGGRPPTARRSRTDRRPSHDPNIAIPPRAPQLPAPPAVIARR